MPAPALQPTPAASAPRSGLFGRFLLVELFKGLWLTLKYTFKPKVTIEYPK